MVAETAPSSIFLQYSHEAFDGKHFDYTCSVSLRPSRKACYWPAQFRRNKNAF